MEIKKFVGFCIFCITFFVLGQMSGEKHLKDQKLACITNAQIHFSESVNSGKSTDESTKIMDRDVEICGGY